jgi:tetratricopeptide (TPR) repeat protein
VFLSALALSAAPLAGQELPLQRDYPGSGPYVCPAPVLRPEPGPDERAQAGQLASEANQAMILGDFERVATLLQRASALNPTSADLAYRHAVVLEDLGLTEPALLEICRAIDLDVASIGVIDAQDRLTALSEAIREQLPDDAREAFISGLARTDSALFASAIDDFTLAIEAAPDWGAPVFNRGLVYEHIGQIQDGLADYRRYLQLSPSDIDPVVMLASERIGLLEGVASVTPPSPTGALALGVMPGMGQYYTGRPVPGTIALGTALTSVAAGFLIKDITTVCLNEVPAGQPCPSDEIVEEITDLPYLWVGVGIGAAVTIVAAVDAYLKAKRRSQEAAAIIGPQPDPGPQFAMPSVSARGRQVDFNVLADVPLSMDAGRGIRGLNEGLRKKRPGFLWTLLALAGVLLIQSCTNRDVVGVVIGTVTVAPETVSLLEGAAQQFRATVTDENGRALPRATVTWTSEAPENLSISPDGMSVARKAGVARVRATFRDASGTADIRIIPAPAIALSQDSVVFYGATGAQSPQAALIEVTNGGGGTLSGLTATVVFGSDQTPDWLAPVLANDSAPTTLTLTPQTATLPVGNYDATVSVTAPDDLNGPSLITVRLSLTGITVEESGAASVVAEAGGTDEFTVVLDSRPDSAVVLDLTSGDSTEVLVSPATLTFDSGNWDVRQTVTMTGQDDVTSDGDQVTVITVSVDTLQSDPAFVPVTDRTVVATTVDDDEASITIEESGGTTEVSEVGGSDTLTIVLDVQPLTPVSFNVSGSDSTEVSVSPATVTFTDVDWDVPQTVTVTGVDDDAIDGVQSSFVFIAVDPDASDDAFDTLAPDSVPLATTDDDVAGLLVVESPPTSGQDTTFVTEAGDTDEFSVVLEAQPFDDVVLSVASGDPGEVVASPAIIVFTSLNWNTPVSVTVTGVDDDLIDGNRTTPVTVSVDAANSDDDFDSLGDHVVNVVTADDDLAGFRIVESDGTSSVTENGGTDDFTVVLLAEPTAPVVIDVSSDDASEVSVLPSTLSFDPSDWNTPQTVTVTGQDDLVDDGDQLIRLSVVIDPALSDDDFDSTPADSLFVTALDDDTAGFVLAQTGGGTLVTEALSIDTLTLVLTSQPVVDVVLTITSADLGEVTVSPTSVTFTPATWDSPQTVTVAGVDDLLNDDDQFTLIGVAVSAGLSDDAFDPVPDQTVSVTTTDNDSDSGFTLTAIDGTTVTEGGPADNFTVVLNTQPNTDVVLTLTSSDATEVAVSPTTVTFTGSDWNFAQTVTVTSVDDDIIDGTQVSTITVAVDDAASDDAFDVVPDSLVTVQTLDNDVAGISVSAASGPTTEAGGTATFSVVLDAEPSGDVTIGLSSSNLAEGTVGTTSLTFTPPAGANPWNVAQIVASMTPSMTTISPIRS